MSNRISNDDEELIRGISQLIRLATKVLPELNSQCDTTPS
jgi:hypothetical protein